MQNSNNELPLVQINNNENPLLQGYISNMPDDYNNLNNLYKSGVITADELKARANTLNWQNQDDANKMLMNQYVRNFIGGAMNTASTIPYLTPAGQGALFNGGMHIINGGDYKALPLALGEGAIMGKIGGKLVEGASGLIGKVANRLRKPSEQALEENLGRVLESMGGDAIGGFPVSKPNIPSIPKTEYHASLTKGVKNIEPRSSSTDWGAFTTQIPDYALQSYGDVGGSLYKVAVPNSSRVINELQPLARQSKYIQDFNSRLFELNPDVFLPTESSLGEDITGRLSNVISSKYHPNYYGLTPEQWESNILGRYLRRQGIEGITNPEFTESHYFRQLPVISETPITKEMMNNINVDNIMDAIHQGWNFK